MAGKALSPIFNRPGIAGFTFMRAGEKFPPIEEGWQKKGHSFEEAAAYQGNIGLMAGNGYIGLDQDKPEAFRGLILPSTTTWETRPGRLGMWFKCNDRTLEVLAKYGKKADQAQIKLFDGRVIVDGYHRQVGEVKLERTYQVIPPSWKEIDGQRVNYRMLEEIPPAEISLDWLLSELLRIGIVFSEKPKDNAQRLEGIRKEATDKRLHKTSKAREFLLEAAMKAKPGHRNDKGFWLACQLRDLGLEVGEASEYMREFAKGLEDSEAEPYTDKEAMNSLEQAYSKTPRDPPSSEAVRRGDGMPLADALLLINDLKNHDKLKTNPGLPYGLRYIEALAAIKIDNRAEYERVIAIIKKAGISTKDLGKEVKIEEQRTKAAVRKETAKKAAIPEDIQAEALRILKYGDPLKFMLDTFNESHVGDREPAKSQFISFGLQSALNTKGIVDGWEGPSGSGKSDASKACVRQLPEEYAFTRTVTAKSLYMHKDDLRPGMVIFMDDVSIEAGSDLEATIKRAQTFFQEGAEHETLDAQRKLLVVKLPPRLLFLRTNVDSRAADSQLANRSLGLNVDSSPEIDDRVCDNVLSLAEEGKTSDSLTRNVLICRAMWQDIKTNVYRVKMQEIKTLIKILSKKNRRNPSVFTDMVVGLACIRHRQRDKEPGENGETILYAAYQDYVDAAEVFNHHAAYLNCRLDPSERAVIRYLASLKEESATIGDIHNFLRLTFPNDGWGDSKTRRLILGRKERNMGGLLEKCADIEPIDGISKSNRPIKRYKWAGSQAAFELYDTGVGVKVYSPEEKGIDRGLPKYSHLFPELGKPQNDNNSPTDSPTLPNIPNSTVDWKMKMDAAQGMNLPADSST